MKLKITIIEIQKIDEEQIKKTSNNFLNMLHDNLLDVIHTFDSNVVTYDVEMTNVEYDRNRLTMSFETDIENHDDSNFQVLFNIKIKQFIKSKLKKSSIFVNHVIVEDK